MRQTIAPLIVTTAIILLFSTMFGLVNPFMISPPRSAVLNTNNFALHAKKKKKSRKTTSSSGGGGSSFGGGALEKCPCGSGSEYSKCCGKIHLDVNAYKAATAEQVVRARYSAYAKKQPDFLMATTHPLHKEFNTDLKAWKETIKQNMYDNFDMNQCKIVKEQEIDKETAEVTFVANLIYRETGELTAFMETSQLERAKTHGGWLYRNGTIASAPGEEGEDGHEESPLADIAEPIYSKGPGDTVEEKSK